MVTSRSHESVIKEVTAMTKHPLWKGYVSDVGGPSANFRKPSCAQQLKNGMCANRSCLAPTPCKNIDADHSDYLTLLRKLRNIPGVKKVFVRSGIRYDFMLCDKKGDFFAELVKYHISGQLKVAPEHCIDSVLDCMGKPHIDVYERFMEKYRALNVRYDKEQYVVPYLMSSHPGSTLESAIALALYLKKTGRRRSRYRTSILRPARSRPACTIRASTRGRWSRCTCRTRRRKRRCSGRFCSFRTR